MEYPECTGFPGCCYMGKVVCMQLVVNLALMNLLYTA